MIWQMRGSYFIPVQRLRKECEQNNIYNISKNKQYLAMRIVRLIFTLPIFGNENTECCQIHLDVNKNFL